MKNLLLTIFCSILLVSCGENTAQPQRSVPQPTPTPGTFPDLNESERITLDELLPSDARDILESSESLELARVECTGIGGSDIGPMEPSKFQGCDVKREVLIKDSSIKRKLLDAVFSAAARFKSGSACFSPAHGLRAQSKGKRVEMLICFECDNFRGVSTTGSFGGGFSRDPQSLFESLLEKK